MAAAGMSWPKVLVLARRHDVPVVRISSRCHAVNAAAFVAACERAAEAMVQTPRLIDQIIAGAYDGPAS